MNRQSRALLTIIVAAAVLVPYWLWQRVTDEGPPPSAVQRSEPVPQRGGQLMATTRTEPRSFNRIVQPEVATEIFSLLTQGRLLRINRATQEIEPWLAESWTTSADGRRFTFTLRDGLTWSDGVPFTSADVAFTLDAVYDPRTASPMASAMRLGGQRITVTTPDARTVDVTYPETFGPGVRLLDLVPIMPKHKLEGALAAGTFAKAWGTDTPAADLLSLGPYVFSSYQPGERMVFERNPRYWRKDERGVALPYTDRVTIEFLPDQDAELVRLQAGQSDFAQQALRPTDLETVRPEAEQGKVRIVEMGVSPDADSLVFNLRPARWLKDPRGAWLTTATFRQALSHAVDRERFADTVFLGAAVPVHGPITPGNRQWFWPSIPRYEPSVEKARALLTSLGLANRDSDEWLEDAAGREVRFTLLTFRGNAALERGAAVLREEFRKVGVAIDVVALEPNTVRSQVVGGDFEGAFINFQASDPDPAMSRDLWISSGSAHFWNPNQARPGTEWEKQIDELMAKQAATIDVAERKRLFNEVQRIFAEQLPMLHFAAPRIYIGASARLLNLQPALTRPPLLWAIDTIGIRQTATP